MEYMESKMDDLITAAMQEEGALSDYQWIRDTLVSVLRVYYLSDDPFIADQMRDVIEAKGIYLPGYERNCDSFNCPKCGAHDYQLFAAALQGCPHCLRAELADEKEFSRQQVRLVAAHASNGERLERELADVKASGADNLQGSPTAWMLTTASGFCRFYTAEFYDVAVMDAERFVTEPATLTPLYKQVTNERN